MEIPLFDDGPADASITWVFASGDSAAVIKLRNCAPVRLLDGKAAREFQTAALGHCYDIGSCCDLSFGALRLNHDTLSQFFVGVHQGFQSDRYGTWTGIKGEGHWNSNSNCHPEADSEAAAAEEEMLLDCELSGEDCQEVFQVCRAQVPPDSGVASDRPAVSSGGGKSGEMPSSLLCGGRQQCPVGSKDLQERFLDGGEAGKARPEMACGSPNEKKNMASGDAMVQDAGLRTGRLRNINGRYKLFNISLCCCIAFTMSAKTKTKNSEQCDLAIRFQARSWVLVVVGVLILLRLRLILLAAALPLVAYWLEARVEEEAAEEDAELDESDELEQEDENKEDAAEIYDHDFWAEKVSDSRVRTLEQNKTLCFCLADVKDILARPYLTSFLPLPDKGRDELDDLLDRDLDSHRKGSRKHLWWTQVGQATQAALASRVADEPFTDGSHMEEDVAHLYADCMEASASNFYQLGLGHLHGGDVRAAYEDFREAARIDPTDFEIWQKYEETYRQVEGDIAEQHREHNVDRTVRSLRAPPERQVKAPRHFTLKVSRTFSALEAAGEDVDEENARAVFLRGGSLFTSQQADVDVKDESLEMIATSPRRYFFILLAWSLTGLLTVYHYRSLEGARKMNPLEVFGWVALVLVMLVYAVWRHHQRPFRLRASDVIKILAVLVILICALYHIAQTAEKQAPHEHMPALMKSKSTKSGDAKDRDKGFGDFGLGTRWLNEEAFIAVLHGLDREPDFDFGPSLGNGRPSKSRLRDPVSQVFVANIGEAHEERMDDLRSFFEDAGEVERLKVLRNPDGGSKGIGFVTFRTEEQALSFHNRPFEGGHIVVRLAHGGKGKGDREKGEKGDKGEGDFRGDRENRDRPKGKARGKGKVPMADVEDLIEQVSDFDFTAKKFVAERESQSFPHAPVWDLRWPCQANPSPARSPGCTIVTEQMAGRGFRRQNAKFDQSNHSPNGCIHRTTMANVCTIF
ncbi:mrd1 [Symbiodinium microadriaticum]|nr:mrd1 [Symbiodinium microadriaticum]